MSNLTFSISSITKKIILAFAGLFLICFLLVHLGINLFLLPITKDHEEIFTEAAHFMGTNLFIKAFEIVLFAAFIIHIIFAVILQIQNWKARGHAYKICSKSKTSFLSKYIIYSGLLIFLFLLLHFYQFYFVKLGWVSYPQSVIPLPQDENFYAIAKYLFTNDFIFSILYVVAFIILGIHLNHSFQSAFQTLGLNHSKYTPFIKALGTVYAFIIAIGYSIIPIYFMIFG